MSATTSGRRKEAAASLIRAGRGLFHLRYSLRLREDFALAVPLDFFAALLGERRPRVLLPRCAPPDLAGLPDFAPLAAAERRLVVPVSAERRPVERDGVRAEVADLPVLSRLVVLLLPVEPLLFFVAERVPEPLSEPLRLRADLRVVVELVPAERLREATLPPLRAGYLFSAFPRPEPD